MVYNFSLYNPPNLAISGYGDEPDDPKPPSMDGDDDVCPFCRLSPCIIVRPPTWLRGSAQANLGNMSKQFTLYRKFWTLLGQLLWACRMTHII